MDPGAIKNRNLVWSHFITTFCTVKTFFFEMMRRHCLLVDIMTLKFRMWVLQINLTDVWTQTWSAWWASHCNSQYSCSGLCWQVKSGFQGKCLPASLWVSDSWTVALRTLAQWSETSADRPGVTSSIRKMVEMRIPKVRVTQIWSAKKGEFLRVCGNVNKIETWRELVWW